MFDSAPCVVSDGELTATALFICGTNDVTTTKTQCLSSSLCLPRLNEYRAAAGMTSLLCSTTQYVRDFIVSVIFGVKRLFKVRLFRRTRD